MAKFVLLFVAAVAFHAAVADHQQQTRQVQEMARPIKQKSSDLSDIIQAFQVDDTKGRRFMTYQANDFAHTVQNVVYKMQQTAQSTQGEKQKKIKEIAGKLGEHAYAIRQAMYAEPNQMKTQLKTQIEHVGDEIEKMKTFIEHETQEDQCNIKNEMKHAVSDLMAALKRIFIQMENHKKTLDEVANQMQTFVGQVAMYTQKVNTFDEQTAKDMAHQAQQFAHMMIEMVDKLEREVDKQEGQIKEQIRQMTKQMIDTQAMVEKVSNAQGDHQARVNEMKDKLQTACQALAGHVHTMMQMAKTNSQDEHMRMMMKCVMTDAVAAVDNMQTQLKVIAENNKH